MFERSKGDAVRQVLERRLGEVTAAALECVTRAMNGNAATVLGAEQTFRDTVMKVAVAGLETAVLESDLEMRGALRARGHFNLAGQVCHGRLRSKGLKATTVMTLLGEAHVTRWTAQCVTCDRLLGAFEELFQTVEGMTPGCANGVALAGVTVAYEPAQKSLLQREGLAVDDNRVKRLADALGPRATECFQEMPAPSRRRLPPKGTRVYVMMDGGRIRLRAKGGAWREPCLGLLLWETPDGKWVKYGISHPTDKDRVLTVLDQWMKVLAPSEDGVENWEVVIIADGADWIWTWAAKYPWAIPILDYYHMKKYLWDAGKTLHGEGTPETAAWVKEMRDMLWLGQVYKVEMRLDQLVLSGNLNDVQKAALERAATYFRNHGKLIAYRKHRKQGRLIGSGAIESLCKQVFTMRMKGPGMFWSEDGAEHLMALRTLYVTGQWESLWNQPIRRITPVREAA